MASKQNRSKKSKQKLNQSNNNVLSQRCFSAWKYSAKRRGIEWDLTIEYLRELAIEQDFKCALTMEPLLFARNHSLQYSLQNSSLDRIDNKKGYFKGNVRLVTKKVNLLRGVLTDDELIELCIKILTISNYRKIMTSYNLT